MQDNVHKKIFGEGYTGGYIKSLFPVYKNPCCRSA